jgi:hypothetical protein
MKLRLGGVSRLVAAENVMQLARRTQAADLVDANFSQVRHGTLRGVPQAASRTLRWLREKTFLAEGLELAARWTICLFA